jgi:Protein of unknown function (DUF3019)
VRRKTVVLLIVTLLFVAVPVAANDNTVTLSIKPLLCVTDKREDSCDLTFLVLWEATRAGRYCLYNDFSSAPLDCWIASAAGRFSEERVVTDRFQYWLTAADGEQRLAEATVEIMTMDSSDRRRQRRSRHVWSIL